MSFILASASPRRATLLELAGLAPKSIVPAQADETPMPGELAHLYVKRVAKLKCESVAQRFPDEIVLAADTAVACGRRILPKAEDEATARKCLALLSGRRHRVYTGVAIFKPGQKMLVKSVMTQVAFERLRPSDIERYIASREWEGKAGGYAIQGLAGAFIPSINGSYTNVVGLPLAEVRAWLAGMGITGQEPAQRPAA